MTEELQEEQNVEEPLDKKDLKVMAYRQTVAEQQEQIANLRVELTWVTAQLEQALQALNVEDVPKEEPKSVPKKKR